MNSGNYSSTSYHINHANRSLSISDKLDNTLVIHTELVNALRVQGCAHCKELFHNILKKYGSSPSSQATDYGASNRDELIEAVDIRRK